MQRVLVLLGWVGAGALLVAYVQTSRGRWGGTATAFQACSVAGSIGLGLAAAGGGV